MDVGMEEKKKHGRRTIVYLLLSATATIATALKAVIKSSEQRGTVNERSFTVLMATQRCSSHGTVLTRIPRCLDSTATSSNKLCCITLCTNIKKNLTLGRELGIKAIADIHSHQVK